MPIVLLAHGRAVSAEPIAHALNQAGWVVHRQSDAAAALADAARGNLAAVLVVGFDDDAALALVDGLTAAHPDLPVLVVAPDSAQLALHRDGPHPARAYLAPSTLPKALASEVLRAARTLSARPTSGAHAVMAAMRELDMMRADGPPPLPTEQAAPQEVERLKRRASELELETHVLQRRIDKEHAEHAHAVSARNEMVRHLELALEALTADLSNAATGLAEQQDRAGNSETRLARIEGELTQAQQQLAEEVALAHAQHKELVEARAQLLAAELDGLSLREALARAVADAQANYQRAIEAESQRADLVRALEQARHQAGARATSIEDAQSKLQSERRDALAQQKHHDDQVSRLKKKLVKAEAALEKRASEALGEAPARKVGRK